MSSPQRPPTPSIPCPTATATTSSPPTPSCTRLLALYLPPDAAAHMRPHFERLGALAGGRLDELAHIADQNPPTLHAAHPHRHRRPAGHKHPAYVEMERLALSEFGLAAMSHRDDTLGWKGSMPPLVKYVLTYLFVQAEFGLCCPVSMTDSLARTLKKFGSPELVERFLPRFQSLDFDTLAQGAMFMTEQAAGSDIAATETRAWQDEAGQLAPRRRQVVLLQPRRRLRDGAGARRRARRPA